MRALITTSYKFLFWFMLLAGAVSCKSNKVLAPGKVDETLSAKTVIKNHYQSQLEFKTISGKMKIDYFDGESTQGVSVSLRMEKDKAIWISAPFGMVKALITPNRVSFYNKLENEFFDGDFSYLSNLLGTDLDFAKIQNVLLGQAIFDLKDGKYDLTLTGNNYLLSPKLSKDLFQIRFAIEPTYFKMASQQVSQPYKNRLLEINYGTYQKTNGKVLPNAAVITAIDKGSKNTIEIEYRNIEFDQPLTFPYEVPEGYNEIVLKKDDI